MLLRDASHIGSRAPKLPLTQQGTGLFEGLRAGGVPLIPFFASPMHPQTSVPSILILYTGH